MQLYRFWAPTNQLYSDFIDDNSVIFFKYRKGKLFAQFFPPTVFFFSVWLSALENGKCEEASQHQHQPQLKKNIFIENSFPGDLTRKRPEIRLSREYQNRKKFGLKFSWSSETLPNSTSLVVNWKRTVWKFEIDFDFF